MTKRRSPRIGGLFEDWLKEEGIHEEVKTASMKRVLAWQLEKAAAFSIPTTQVSRSTPSPRPRRPSVAKSAWS